MIALFVLLISSIALNVLMFFVVKRFILRTLQFDEIFDMIQNDVDSFIEYFDTLLAKSMFSNSPDVMALSNNMKTMRDRFETYVLNVENNSYENEVEDDSRRPVVVD